MTQDNFNTGLSDAGGQNPLDDSLSNKDDSMTMIGFGSSANGFMADKVPEGHKNEVTTGFDEGASSQSSFKEHHYMHTNQDSSVSDKNISMELNKLQVALDISRKKEHTNDRRQVSFEEAYALSTMHGAIYAEVSAMTNQNL